MTFLRKEFYLSESVELADLSDWTILGKGSAIFGVSSAGWLSRLCLSDS